MDIRSTLSSVLDLPAKRFIALEKGLSTQKFLLSRSEPINLPNIDKTIDTSILFRVYTEETHGSNYRKIAQWEKNALDHLKNQTMLIFPDFLGQINETNFIANMVSWIDGKIPQGLDTVISAWSIFSKISKDLQINDTLLPDHDKVILDSLEILSSFLHKHGLDAEQKLIRDFLDSFKNKSGFGHKLLIHGDFHLNNIIQSPNGSIGIIDWEYAAIGNPLFDLSYALLYDYGLQDKPIKEFYTERLSKASKQGISLDKNDLFKGISSISLFLMALWFFERYRQTGREHNLAKAMIYLRGGLDLEFRF